MSEKFSVIAKNGMVASSQPLATLAGVEILVNGGNAIDAAIATAAVLGVVEPSSIGIGSDAFCLFYSAKDRAIKSLDASGRSPYAMGLDFCRKSRVERDAAAGHSLGHRARCGAWLDDIAECLRARRNCRRFCKRRSATRTMDFRWPS